MNNIYDGMSAMRSLTMLLFTSVVHAYFCFVHLAELCRSIDDIAYLLLLLVAVSSELLLRCR